MTEEFYYTIKSSGYEEMFSLIREIISEHVVKYNMECRPFFRKYTINTHRNEEVNILFYSSNIKIEVNKRNWFKNLCFRFLDRMIIEEFKNNPIIIKNINLAYAYHLNVKNPKKEEIFVSIVYYKCVFDVVMESDMCDFASCIFNEYI